MYGVQLTSLVLLSLIGFIIVRVILTRRRHAEQRATMTLLSSNVARIDSTLSELVRRVATHDVQLASLLPSPAVAEVPASAPAMQRQAETTVVTETVQTAPESEAAEEILPPQFVPATLLANERSEATDVEPPVEIAPARLSFRPPVTHPARRSALRRLGASLAAGIGQAANVEPGEKVSWEAIIGGRWLNLIGMLVLVVGIALLSQQALVHLPPAGKIEFGSGLGIAMIVAGILLERSKTYLWIGRTLIGGGWAILYFTAYAAFGVQQAKIIDSPTVALGVLAAVAVGMLFHSLRYRNQVVTGLAFGLAFLAIVLTPVTLAGIVGSAVLAAALVVISRQLSWHHLAAVGVVGTYANHWLWLQKFAATSTLTTPASGLDAMLPGAAVFWLSCGILAFYWILFSIVSISRRDDRQAQPELHAFISMANTLGLAGLLYFQVTHAFGNHYLWAITGPVALATAALAYLDHRGGQRPLFLINGGLSLAAYSVTLPLAIAEHGWLWGWTAPYFTVAGLLAILVGIVTREQLLRLAGYGLALLAFLNVLTVRLWEPGANHIDLLWLATLATVVAHQAAAEVLLPLKADQPNPATGFSLSAALMLAGLIWIHLPHDMVGAVWMGLGLVLFELGARLHRDHQYAGYVLIGLAAFAAIAVNVYGYAAEPPAFGLPGWLFGALVALGFYYLVFRMRRLPAALVGPDAIAEFASSVASLLVVLLLWHELPAMGVAVAWASLGLLLFEAGIRLDMPALRAQAHLVLIAAFVRVFMANLVIDEPVTTFLSYRLVTVVPVALTLLYMRLQLPLAEASRKSTLFGGVLAGEAKAAAGLYSWALAILVVLLFRFEFGRAHTVAAWAPLLLVLLYLGRSYADRNLRFQSYALALYGFFRGWSTNIYLEGVWLNLPERISTTVPMIAALFAASLLGRGSKVPEQPASAERPGRVRRALSFADRNAPGYFATLGAAFLAVLLYYELSSQFVSIGLAVEGLALLVLGFALAERSYRLIGLATLGGTLLKVVFIDLAGVEDIYRIASFIVLGVILLLVSVGYTRYRSVIERYI